jgi:hypothetical protein
MSILTG